MRSTKKTPERKQRDEKVVVKPVKGTWDKSDIS
jgi:hypothetical protein